ncbi:MAG: DUF2461 domain-containing protein [Flavisolibacter sp.]
MLAPQTLKFLTQLKKNNNKPWFDAHRAQYEAARIDFSNFIQLVIEGLQQTDTTITGMTAKEALYRINRDVRFSKNKLPYKTHLAGFIIRGGKKSGFAGYYFHCEPGNSFAGGGLWQPEPAVLKNVRQEIDYNYDSFRSILREKNFKKIYGDLYQGEDIKLSTVPKGYEKDNPAIGYLKLKSFIAETRFEDEDLLRHSLHKKTVAAFEALHPFVRFINEALSA